jgi:hypothetical protein
LLRDGLHATGIFIPHNDHFGECMMFGKVITAPGFRAAVKVSGELFLRKDETGGCFIDAGSHVAFAPEICGPLTAENLQADMVLCDPSSWLKGGSHSYLDEQLFLVREALALIKGAMETAASEWAATGSLFIQEISLEKFGLTGTPIIRPDEFLGVWLPDVGYNRYHWDGNEFIVPGTPTSLAIWRDYNTGAIREICLDDELMMSASITITGAGAIESVMRGDEGTFSAVLAVDPVSAAAAIAYLSSRLSAEVDALAEFSGLGDWKLVKAAAE